MRLPGEILLLSCYELGHQPTVLASAAAFLGRAGFRPLALDLSLDALDPTRLQGLRLVAISVPMHTALRLGVRAAEGIRAAAPGAHRCFFGLYAALNAERLLALGLADSIIAGEAEGELVELARALERQAPIELDGVSTRGRRAPPTLRRLDFLPPDRSSLPPLARYAPLIEADQQRIAGHLEASRGCKHRCRHCPITPVYGGRFFAVPLEVVLADARAQVAAGARHLSFGDPDFLNGPAHALRIARALHAEHPQTSFDITTKVEHILRHPGVFPELRQLGCAFVVSALESLSDRVLERLDKGHSCSDVSEALAILDRAGLPLRPTFLPFTPWSTLEDLLELFDWVAANDLVESVDPIQFTVRLLVPPGSRLLEIAAEPDRTGTTSGAWPGALDADAFTYRWRHPDPRMDVLQATLERRVEAGAAGAEAPRATFAALRALARAAAGLPERPMAPMTGPRRDHPPRLAEAWFC